MGRRSIFRGKSKKLRVQGILTPAGMRAFNKRRKVLAKMAKCKPGEVSHADVIEALARGERETRKYLAT